jgi:hypothetical protein
VEPAQPIEQSDKERGVDLARGVARAARDALNACIVPA